MRTTKIEMGVTALILLGFLVKLAIIGGLIYAGVHFVTKYW